MVITYNHNLHFRIHCKNSKNNIIIHFIIIWYYKKFTQKMNIKFIVEVCASLYYWKHESKLQHNPMFCWKNPKQHLKSMLYQNKICVFFFVIT
jgi:hypothetical protein